MACLFDTICFYFVKQDKSGNDKNSIVIEMQDLLFLSILLIPIILVTIFYFMVVSYIYTLLYFHSDLLSEYFYIIILPF